ncbi:Fc.00g083780.m01.CDS01 [Cosmosporella sp. VM-42]
MADILIVSAQKRRAEDSSRDQANGDKSARRKLNKTITTTDVQHLVVKRDPFSSIEIMPRGLRAKICSKGDEAPPRDVLEEWAQKLFHMVGRNYSKHRECYNKLLEMLKSTKPWKGGTFKDWSRDNGFTSLVKKLDRKLAQEQDFVWTIPAAFILAALAKNSIEFAGSMLLANPKVQHYWNVGILDFLGPTIDAFHPDVTEVFPLGRKEVSAKRLASTKSSLFYPDDPLYVAASELTETDKRKPQVVHAVDFQVEHSLLLQEIGNIRQIPSQEVLREKVFRIFNKDTVRLLRSDQKDRLAEWFAYMGHTKGQDWCTQTCQNYVMILALSTAEKEQLGLLNPIRLEEDDIVSDMSVIQTTPVTPAPRVTVSDSPALEQSSIGDSVTGKRWTRSQYGLSPTKEAGIDQQRADADSTQEKGPNKGHEVQETVKDKTPEPGPTITEPSKETLTEQKPSITKPDREKVPDKVHGVTGSIEEKTEWLKEHRGIMESQLRDWRLLAIGARVESGSSTSLLSNTVNSLASHVGGAVLVEVLIHDIDNDQSKDRKYKQLAERWDDVLE